MKILTINAGSSSLKACLFNDEDGSRLDFRYTNITEMLVAFNQLLSDLKENKPDIIGHRVVHGGDIKESSRLLDDEEYNRLNSMINLAPLHLPANLLGYKVCKTLFNVPQVACYDTAFHSTIPERNYRLPIPTSLGFRKYGFHGLNYAYITKELFNHIGYAAYGKIIIAHLGSGSSLCLIKNGESVDTTMGFTPAGGVIMGTRSGDIDPGVVIELSKCYSPDKLNDIFFKKSGILALSGGLSSDMQGLCTFPSGDGEFAINAFCASIREAIGGMAAKEGGIDTLVFTGGIGENSAMIRSRIVGPLEFLGIKRILTIKADEEKTIYDLCKEYESTESI